MIASAGSSIHALEAGRVTRLDSGRVRLLTESGLLVDYFGVDGAAAEPGGRDVPAGAVVGALIPTGGPAGLGELVLRIQDGAGVLLDAADLLVGSTDPAELGVSPAGAGPAGNGLGLDPEQLDRELVEPRETTT